MYVKSSDPEEEIEIDHEPHPDEMPVLDLKLPEEEEEQTLELDEGFGEFDPGSSEHAELLKEKKVGFQQFKAFQMLNIIKKLF